MEPALSKSREIELKRNAAAARYPELWQRIMVDWARPAESDRAWLLYSANYLFCTGGVRWALDPLTLQQRIDWALQVDVSPLANLDYLVLSHRHADHLDLKMLQHLGRYSATWIVPEFMLGSLSSLGLPQEKFIIARPAEALHLGHLTLTPFAGLHWEKAPDYPDGQRGVPSMGYLAEFNGKRCLFPGDTRTYDAGQLPCFGKIDTLFAHVWLGRGMALQDRSPWLEPFCRFIVDLSPRRVLLTHLEEFGRIAPEYWDATHAGLITQRLGELAPWLQVEVAFMGDALEL